MPKEDWGAKRVCPTTGKRFYDMNRNPIVSPYTGEVVVLDTGKGGRTLVADKADPKTAAKEAKEEDELVLDDDLDIEDDNGSDVDIEDDVLDDDDDGDTVALDDIADVASDGGDDD